jgi:hypothetical protein
LAAEPETNGNSDKTGSITGMRQEYETGELESDDRSHDGPPPSFMSRP